MIATLYPRAATPDSVSKVKGLACVQAETPLNKSTLPRISDLVRVQATDNSLFWLLSTFRPPLYGHDRLSACTGTPEIRSFSGTESYLFWVL